MSTRSRDSLNRIVYRKDKQISPEEYLNDYKLEYITKFREAHLNEPMTRKRILCKKIGLSESTLNRFMKDLNVKSFYRDKKKRTHTEDARIAPPLHLPVLPKDRDALETIEKHRRPSDFNKDLSRASLLKKVNNKRLNRSGGSSMENKKVLTAPIIDYGENSSSIIDLEDEKILKLLNKPLIMRSKINDSHQRARKQLKETLKCINDD